MVAKTEMQPVANIARHHLAWMSTKQKPPSKAGNNVAETLPWLATSKVSSVTWFATWKPNNPINSSLHYNTIHTTGNLHLTDHVCCWRSFFLCIYICICVCLCSYVGFHWYQLSIIDISGLIFWTCHGVVPVSGCVASPSPLASLALAPLPSWHRRGAPRRRGHQCCERQRRWRPQRGLRYTYLIYVYIYIYIYIYIHNYTYMFLYFVLCHNCNSLQYVDILTTSLSFSWCLIYFVIYQFMYIYIYMYMHVYVFIYEYRFYLCISLFVSLNACIV